MSACNDAPTAGNLPSRRARAGGPAELPYRVVSMPPEIADGMGYTICTECTGTGRCVECDGAGDVGGMPCATCDATGDCTECAGRGKYREMARKMAQLAAANVKVNALATRVLAQRVLRDRL
jgi:hypothetical protein